MSDKTLFNIEVKFWQEVKVFNWKYSWTFDGMKFHLTN